MKYTFKVGKEKIHMNTEELFYAISVYGCIWVKAPTRELEDNCDTYTHTLAEAKGNKTKILYDLEITYEGERIDYKDFICNWSNKIENEHINLKENEGIHIYLVNGSVGAVVGKSTEDQQAKEAYNIAQEKIKQEGIFYDVELKIKVNPYTIHEMVAIDLQNRGIEPVGDSVWMNRWVNTLNKYSKP